MSKRTFFLLAGVFLTATLVKFILNLSGDNGVSWDFPQFSESAAQRQGIYVCLVKPAPSTFQWNGTTISFHEIWIEHQVHTDHPYIWFSRKTRSGEDYLCFTIDSSRAIFRAPNSPIFFSNEAEFSGYGSIGIDKLFYVPLKQGAVARHRANIRLGKDWQDPHSVTIALTW
jgi:hypothetical protein